MPVSPKDLLALADTLMTTSDSGGEAALRAAVGRAYYAAFHALLPVMEYLPASCERAAQASRISHSEVQTRLQQWRPIGPYDSLKRISTSAGAARRAFQAARLLREAADYRLDIGLNLEEVKGQVARCRQLVRFAVQAEHEAMPIQRAERG